MSHYNFSFLLHIFILGVFLKSFESNKSTLHCIVILIVHFTSKVPLHTVLLVGWFVRHSGHCSLRLNMQIRIDIRDVYGTSLMAIAIFTGLA